MKVLMVTDFYPPFMGGVEMLVSSLAQELAARGHEVAVATLQVGGLPDVEIVEGVRVHRLRSTVQRAERLFASSARPWAPPVPDPEVVAGLRTVLARERPDVLHGHDWLARSALPLKRRGLPLVVSLHYFTLSCPKKSLMYMGREQCAGPALTKCLRCAAPHYGAVKGAAVVAGQRIFGALEAGRADLFLPVSESTAAANGLPGRSHRYRVIPNFVRRVPPADGFADELARLPDEPFFLFVGDVRADKGAHVLLDAYRRLEDPPPLVLVGKVWPDTPTTLPPGVTLERDWPNGAVRHAMRRALALVAPSLLPEPFGIVVAESLDAGRPVIASAVGGIPEIITHGRDGLLVTAGDPASLADAMSAIARDAGARERMAAETAAAASRYAPDVVVPQVEDAYRAVAGSLR